MIRLWFCFTSMLPAFALQPAEQWFPPVGNGMFPPSPQQMPAFPSQPGIAAVPGQAEPQEDLWDLLHDAESEAKGMVEDNKNLAKALDDQGALIQQMQTDTQKMSTAESELKKEEMDLERSPAASGWGGSGAPNWSASWKSMRAWEDRQKSMGQDMQAEASLIAQAEELQGRLRKGENLQRKIQGAMAETLRLQAQLDQAKRVISNFREEELKESADSKDRVTSGFSPNWSNPMAMASLRSNMEQVKFQHQQLIASQVGHVEKEQHVQEQLEKTTKQLDKPPSSMPFGMGWM